MYSSIGLVHFSFSPSQSYSKQSRGLYANIGLRIGFDHVACLIEIHLHALLNGANQVHMVATELLWNPLRFMEVIEEQKVTVTFAPNFFLAMVDCAGKNSPMVKNRPVGYSDLSSLRHVVSGGEANVTELAVVITEAVEALGGPKDGVLRTAFGMTEVNFHICRQSNDANCCRLALLVTTT